MQGYSQLHDQGDQPLVFESVTETLAGGGCLDPTGLLTLFPDGVVPAGTLVGKKDATTGLHKVVTITNASPDTYDKDPLGFTMAPVKIDANPLVGIAIEGVVRKEGGAYAGFGGVGTKITSAQFDDLEDDLPRFNFV